VGVGGGGGGDWLLHIYQAANVNNIFINFVKKWLNKFTLATRMNVTQKVK
jgi:hypothetical protein